MSDPVFYGIIIALFAIVGALMVYIFHKATK